MAEQEILPEFETMVRARRAYWRRLLRHTNGCVVQAARIAKVNRTSAYKTLECLGIRIQRYRKPYGVTPLPWDGRRRGMPQTGPRAGRSPGEVIYLQEARFPR